MVLHGHSWRPDIQPKKPWRLEHLCIVSIYILCESTIRVVLVPLKDACAQQAVCCGGLVACNDDTSLAQKRPTCSLQDSTKFFTAVTTIPENKVKHKGSEI